VKNFQEHTILAIDTSCDETSVSVVRGFTILANLLPSQMEYHREFGGVVPSLAKLAHQERIDNVVNKALRRAGVSLKDIDAIAVTYGPGLAIALEVGIKKAKELAQEYSKPVVVVNHMEGHFLSSLAQKKTTKKTFTSNEHNVQEILNKIELPVLGFLISGGHTELVLMKNLGEYVKVGETVDDSCGEAYDKCGRMLGLGYPAGPVISKFAKEHRKNVSIEVVKHHQSTLVKVANKKTKAEYLLPIPMVNSGDLNFSYSGLKTAFGQMVNKLKEWNNVELNREQIFDLCVAFEASALEQLAVKLKKAIDMYSPKEVWLGGGVVASARLRSVLRKTLKNYDIKLRYPFSGKLTGDNSAMIGIAAQLKVYLTEMEHNPMQGIFLNDFEAIDRDPSLSFDSI